MTSLPSLPRVPPSVLLVAGVPAVSGALGAGLAAWLAVEASGGLLWWGLVLAVAALWWLSGRSAVKLAVEVTRDVKAWQARRAERPGKSKSGSEEEAAWQSSTTRG